MRIALESSGRSVLAPDAFSLKILPQPAACSAAPEKQRQHEVNHDGVHAIRRCERKSHAKRWLGPAVHQAKREVRNAGPSREQLCHYALLRASCAAAHRKQEVIAIRSPKQPQRQPQQQSTEQQGQNSENYELGRIHGKAMKRTKRERLART
jgi:hypothetical protein